MTRTRSLGILCIAVAALPAAGSSAGAPAGDTDDADGMTIRWVGDEITRIGTLRTASSRTRPPTIARAITAFGRPSSTMKTSKVSCRVIWSKLGLRATFVNLGGSLGGRSPCTPSVGLLQTARVVGRGLRTQGGLRVGDSVAQLRVLHPEAYFQDGSFWLATAPAVIGAVDRDQRMWIVRALSTGGVVRSLGLRIGAAGE